MSKSKTDKGKLVKQISKSFYNEFLKGNIDINMKDFRFIEENFIPALREMPVKTLKSIVNSEDSINKIVDTYKNYLLSE